MADDEQPKADSNGSTTRAAEGAWVLEVSEPSRGRVMRASLPISGFGAPDVEVLESPEDEAGYRDPFARHVAGGARLVESPKGKKPHYQDRGEYVGQYYLPPVEAGGAAPIAPGGTGTVARGASTAAPTGGAAARGEGVWARGGLPAERAAKGEAGGPLVVVPYRTRETLDDRFQEDAPFPF